MALLTRQQQTLLVVVIFLLLAGWGTKMYRAAQTPPPVAQTPP